MNSIQKIYENIGAEFLLSAEEIAVKLTSIKAFIFDWDGVFNNGEKLGSGSSPFTEIDSMGTNTLRFSYYLQNKKIPLTAIISGEKNESAFYFAEREHFNSSYFKVLQKKIAIDHFCKTHNIKPSEICYFFDDVLDLDVARDAGLRILVNRKATTLFTHYVKQNKLADYITASESGNFAVREACEMLMGVSNTFNEAITRRTNYDEVYRQFILERNMPITQFFTLKSEEIINAENKV
ncbi:MAG: phosphatase [Bacteroidia bacterium]